MNKYFLGTVMVLFLVTGVWAQEKNPSAENDNFPVRDARINMDLLDGASQTPIPAVSGGEQTFEPVRDLAEPVPAAAQPQPLSAASAPAANPAGKARVVFNPPTDRDPTLSPEDALLFKHREQQRLAALEAERKRKLEAERKRLAELERQRQLELDRLRNPAREVMGKIRVGGIIGEEVFIGNRVYSVGQSVMGARILKVGPDSVQFIYKGQKFTKKVQLK